MTEDDRTPRTEKAGSSAVTAVAVGAGAVLGSVLLVAAAPLVLPLVGLGALAAAVSPIVGATIGGIVGWKFWGRE